VWFVGGEAKNLYTSKKEMERNRTGARFLYGFLWIYDQNEQYHTCTVNVTLIVIAGFYHLSERAKLQHSSPIRDQ
jgi:hypothetical protein